MEQYEINGHNLKFYPDTHTYLVDDVIVPSATTILHNTIFKDMYKGVSEEVLNEAGVLGTAMHKAIEDYEKDGTETPIEELRSYKLIKRLYKFDVQHSEIPIIVEIDGEVMCAGKLDQIINMPIKIGDETKQIKCVNDFKRTSVLNKEYLAYQETIYAIGYEQCYGEKIDELRGTHLRKDKKEFKKIKRIDDEVIRLLKEYHEKNKIEIFL